MTNGSVDFAGHRLAYRVIGRGPALVLLNLYRRRADMMQAQLLGDRWQVFQIFPARIRLQRPGAGIRR